MNTVNTQWEPTWASRPGHWHIATRNGKCVCGATFCPACNIRVHPKGNNGCTNCGGPAQPWTRDEAIAEAVPKENP